MHILEVIEDCYLIALSRACQLVSQCYKDVRIAMSLHSSIMCEIGGCRDG